MSLAGLRYTSHGGSISGPQETKSGSYIYSGNPNGFFEWEFRTKVRVALHKQKHAKKKSEKTYSSHGSQSATPERSQRRPTYATEAGDVSEDDEARFEAFGTPKSESVAGEEEPALSTAGLDDDGAEYATLVHKVLEGLRGDAYLTAQDMGLEKLLTPTGIDELISRIRAQVFPLRQQEARELFRVGQLPHGPLSRQTTESMTSYISRRRRWWRKLLEMDDGVSLSDPMRGELLLEGSGLSKTEQLMIKTAAGDNQSFDVYAKFLLEFHGQIHLRSWSAFGNTSPRRQKGGGKFSGKSSYKGGKGRSWQRSAYIVEDDSWDYEESYEPEAEDDYEHEAYVAAEDEEPEDEEHEDYVEDPASTGQKDLWHTLPWRTYKSSIRPQGLKGFVLPGCMKSNMVLAIDVSVAFGPNVKSLTNNRVLFKSKLGLAACSEFRSHGLDSLNPTHKDGTLGLGF